MVDYSSGGLVMKERTTTITGLIKNMNLMSGDLAPMCAQIFTAFNHKLEAHSQAVYGDVFKQAVADIHFSTIELQTMRSLFKANQYVTKKDYRVDCLIYGIMGGLIGCAMVVAVLAALHDWG